MDIVILIAAVRSSACREGGCVQCLLLVSGERGNEVPSIPPDIPFKGFYRVPYIFPLRDYVGYLTPSFPTNQQQECPFCMDTLP